MIYKVVKRDSTLAILKEKEVFGELSLLDSETRSASATCHTDCFLFKLDQEPFYELLEARPEIARGFIKILCQRLRLLNEKIVTARN
jgi:CRP-like cAMP-binding protein